ncbi:MAG: IS3 family transposase [Sphaerochaetaceae bacterium]
MGAAVSVAFVENRQWYGYCQLHAVLPSEGSIISEKMVLRLMEKLNTVKVA